MKKLLGLRLYQALLTTVAFFIAILAIVGAQSGSDSQIVVMATVLPERSIVVDSDLTIQQIYSNTLQDVRPNVYRGKIDGSTTAYSDSIREQYEQLSNSIDFSKPGKVYERPSSPLGSFFRSTSNFIKRLLGL